MTVEPSHKLPRSVSIQLTEACNLRCRMCYEWGETGVYTNPEGPRKPAVLDVELVKRVVDELASETRIYSLFGGEPLIYPRLEEVVRAMKEAGSYVDTPTNGTALAQHAAMLVETGFDSVRVSLDGPRQVDERQRGAGSYDKAMAGIEALAREKRATGSPTPQLGLIYTVTRENHLAIEEFFLRELDLAPIDSVTIQMQNFVTETMGEAYSRLLESKFGLSSQRYWRSVLRSPEDFRGIDVVELARQVEAVGRRLEELGKRLLLLPPTFSPANLDAYLRASWDEMADRYRGCAIPWQGADITARGELAPCHVFYDLVLGSLYEHTLRELWNGEGYRRFREHVKQSGLTPICPGCCILYLVNRPSRGAVRRREVRGAS